MSNITLRLTSSIEDVPKEISYFLTFVKEELSVVSSKAGNLAESVGNEDIDKEAILKFMHHIRAHLVQVDTRIEDCMSIWAGYLDVLQNPSPTDEIEEIKDIEEESDAER